MIERGQSVVGGHETVQIARAVSGEPDTDMRLHDGDVLTIRQLAESIVRLCGSASKIVFHPLPGLTKT